jgi:hypothetical protein
LDNAASNEIALSSDAVDSNAGGQLGPYNTTTHILLYFSDLLAARKNHEPLFGADLLSCIKAAIPSAL